MSAPIQTHVCWNCGSLIPLAAIAIPGQEVTCPRCGTVFRFSHNGAVGGALLPLSPQANPGNTQLSRDRRLSPGMLAALILMVALVSAALTYGLNRSLRPANRGPLADARQEQTQPDKGSPLSPKDQTTPPCNGVPMPPNTDLQVRGSGLPSGPEGAAPPQPPGEPPVPSPRTQSSDPPTTADNGNPAAGNNPAPNNPPTPPTADNGNPAAGNNPAPNNPPTPPTADNGNPAANNNPAPNDPSTPSTADNENPAANDNPAADDPSTPDNPPTPTPNPSAPPAQNAGIPRVEIRGERNSAGGEQRLWMDQNPSIPGCRKAYFRVVLAQPFSDKVTVALQPDAGVSVSPQSFDLKVSGYSNGTTVTASGQQGSVDYFSGTVALYRWVSIAANVSVNGTFVGSATVPIVVINNNQPGILFMPLPDPPATIDDLNESPISPPSPVVITYPNQPRQVQVVFTQPVPAGLSWGIWPGISPAVATVALPKGDPATYFSQPPQISVTGGSTSGNFQVFFAVSAPAQYKNLYIAAFNGQNQVGGSPFPAQSSASNTVTPLIP